MKTPVIKLTTMTGEVVYELVLWALALDHAKALGWKGTPSDFRLFVNGDECDPPGPPGPKHWIEPSEG